STGLALSSSCVLHLVRSSVALALSALRPRPCPRRPCPAHVTAASRFQFCRGSAAVLPRFCHSSSRWYDRSARGRGADEADGGAGRRATTGKGRALQRPEAAGERADGCAGRESAVIGAFIW